MNKIRRGDEVMVLAGANKGGRGEVKRVIIDDAGKVARVVVEGLNMATCFVRPNPQKNEPGGRILREASLHASNVAVIDKESGLPSRVKIERTEKGGVRQFHVSARRRT